MKRDAAKYQRKRRASRKRAGSYTFLVELGPGAAIWYRAIKHRCPHLGNSSIVAYATMCLARELATKPEHLHAIEEWFRRHPI